MMKKALIFYSSISAFFISSLAHSQVLEYSKIPELKKQEWLRLLHYRDAPRDFLGSEIDGGSFFIHPKGHFFPELEFKETLERFLHHPDQTFGVHTQPLLCAFPARKKWFEKNFQLQFLNVDCEKKDTWLKSMPDQSITLLYSAPYFGSPASIFGHTFLRLDHPYAKQLSPTLSFEANAPPSGGFGYALQGLLGFFPGTYQQLPFHLKFTQYTMMENRDLWEYKLNLRPDEINFLLEHLWELSQSYTDYYFFDENCSYHLLSLLEVARPTVALRKNFPLMTIPLDTVRELKKKNLIESTRFVPSLQKQKVHLLTLLNEGEKNELENFRVNQNTESLKSSLVADILILDEQIKKISLQKSLFDPTHLLSPDLVERRSKLKNRNDPPLPVPDSPENSHESTRVSLFTHHEKYRTSTGVEWRIAVHSELDLSDGYLPFSALEIGTLRVSKGLKSNDLSLRLDELQIARATSRTKNSSFSVSGSYLHQKNTTCIQCYEFQFPFSYGKSILSSKNSFTAWAKAKPLYRFYSNQKTDLELAPSLEWILDTPSYSQLTEIYLSSNLRSDFFTKNYVYGLKHESQLNLKKKSFLNFSAHLYHQEGSWEDEFSGSFGFYF